MEQNNNIDIGDIALKMLTDKFGDMETLKLIMFHNYIDAKSRISTEKKAKNSKTYFILDKENNLCKIGQSVTPKKRVKALNVGNGKELVLLKVCDEIEQYYHNLFNKYRVRGEWFEIKGKLKEFLFKA